MGAQSPVIDVMPSHHLAPARRREIIALCEAAFDEDLSTLFESLGASTHLLLRLGDVPVAHACWVERWYQPAGLPPLRTAYIKAVAVAPDRRGEGWGTLAMRRVAATLADQALGALVTVRPDFYTRLGWAGWRGPIAIRAADGTRLAAEKRPLVLRTARTPPLDLDAPLMIAWRGGRLW